MSNSSSFSSYSRFSSNSSNPGAKELQFSITAVCQMFRVPADVTEEIMGFVGCHFAEVRKLDLWLVWDATH